MLECHEGGEFGWEEVRGSGGGGGCDVEFWVFWLMV